MKITGKEEIPEKVGKVIDAVDGVMEGDTSMIEVVKVESNYYELTLEERRDQVNAKSINDLCKTLVFENNRLKLLDDGQENPTKHAIVLIQYTDKMSTKKLNSIMRQELLERTGVSQAAKYFNMRLAKEQVALELTGYGNNAVSPFGMTAKNLRIIMSAKIAALDFMFLGAGHVDWKIKVPTKVFIEKTGCLVKDISE